VPLCQSGRPGRRRPLSLLLLLLLAAPRRPLLSLLAARRRSLLPLLSLPLLLAPPLPSLHHRGRWRPQPCLQRPGRCERPVAPAPARPELRQPRAPLPS
jgi:hypothetical protein